MRSYREELWFETKTRRAYINITPHVEQIVKRAAFRKGGAGHHAHHGQRYINDDEQGLLRLRSLLERIRPMTVSPQRTGEDNGMRTSRQVMGREVVVAITNDRWLTVGADLYGEFDGRRKKRVLVKVVGD
jgi:thiamine phosphate synthase YjbQ (UPF0047 family)